MCMLTPNGESQSINFVNCAAEYAYEFNGVSPQLLAAATV